MIFHAYKKKLESKAQMPLLKNSLFHNKEFKIVIINTFSIIFRQIYDCPVVSVGGNQSTQQKSLPNPEQLAISSDALAGMGTWAVVTERERELAVSGNVVVDTRPSGQTLLLTMLIHSNLLTV